MLQQNWFCQPNMEMFYEYFNEQWFYDKNSKAIYIVDDMEKRIHIDEIQEDNPDYKIYYSKYLEYKSNNIPVKLFVEEIKKFFCSCSDNEMEELYEKGTIDISMCGLTTKIPWGAEPYNKIIDVLNSLINNGEIE